MSVLSLPHRSNLMWFRDIIRFVFFAQFFFLEDISAALFGMEIEFENEYVVILAIILFGTYWCGWFCPFGNAQYFSGLIGKKIFRKFQLKIPEKIERQLRHLKIVFFIAFMYVYVTTPHSYFGDHEAMYASTWFTSIFKMVKDPFAVLIIPLFIPRFFCKYLCYQKVIYQIINFVFPFMKIKRNKDACFDCQKCDKKCPMDIEISKRDSIGGGECIGCFKCIDTSGCPEKASALKLTWMGKEYRPLPWAVLTGITYIVLTAVIMFGFGSVH